MIGLEKAVEIAVRFHDGQKDLDGLPVLLHLLAVALIFVLQDFKISHVGHLTPRTTAYR